MKLLISVLVLSVVVCLAAAESGKCSFYGSGKKTANGEKFDPNGMTAAHKTLKFNTKVRVDSGGKSVTVRINDRGPFVAGRILDLTTGAAKQLGVVGKGVFQCTVTVV